MYFVKKSSRVLWEVLPRVRSTAITNRLYAANRVLSSPGRIAERAAKEGYRHRRAPRVMRLAAGKTALGAAVVAVAAPRGDSPTALVDDTDPKLVPPPAPVQAPAEVPREVPSPSQEEVELEARIGRLDETRKKAKASGDEVKLAKYREKIAELRLRLATMVDLRVQARMEVVSPPAIPPTKPAPPPEVEVRSEPPPAHVAPPLEKEDRKAKWARQKKEKAALLLEELLSSEPPNPHQPGRVCMKYVPCDHCVWKRKVEAYQNQL